MSIKRLLLLLNCIIACHYGIAQVSTYSYLYIEGDKETPFYVKMEGQMMPRYGQHYSILSNLDKGTTNIEILFQQNKYPTQVFKVKIPESGARGMQLRKVTETQFALYDLQTGNYILSGNKAEEDNIYALENLNNKANAAETQIKKKDQALQAAKEKQAAEIKKQTDEQVLPKFEAATNNKGATKTEGKVAKEKVINKPNKPVDTLGLTEKKNTAKQSKETKEQHTPKSKTGFIDNVAINSGDEIEVVNNGNLPPNTDCKTVLSEEAFDAFYQRVAGRSEDEDRIKVIGKNKKQCYTTAQTGALLSTIKSQSGRLLMAKQLYAQTSDQEQYHTLKTLFKSDYLQQKFLEIVK